MLTAITPRYAPVETPLGRGWVAYGAGGVVLLEVGSEKAFLAVAVRALGVRPVRRDPPPAFARRVRDGIARGDGTAMDWASIPEFQRAVLQETARIPRGSVRSYGWIAERIGRPRAARAVGTALARNPVPLLVPCHRVVRAGGALGSYGLGGASVKGRLLTAEGWRSA